MKRSEMLKKLQIRLDNIRGSSENGELLYPSDDYLISSLFDEVEKSGILPPVVVGKYDNVPTVSPTGHEIYSWIREWEPENE